MKIMTIPPPSRLLVPRLSCISPCAHMLLGKKTTTKQSWSPNLEAALYNRVVRLLIHCNNAVAFEEGYLLFYVGDAEFAQSCAEFPELCTGDGVDSNSGAAVVVHGGGTAAVSAALGRILVAVGAVSLSALYRRWWFV